MMNPKVKISVEGTLIANGNSNNRIVFTKFNNTSIKQILSNVRLVAGLEIREGRLEVKFQSKWRPICSQNREWSTKDVGVICKELGFVRGNFTLQTRAENDTTHMLLLEPLCIGNETSLTKCPGFVNASIGSAICNLQELVGLHCWGANEEMFQDNWSGLTFYNSTTTETVMVTHNSRFNVSQSQLSFVDILHAGVNWTNHRVAALSSSPYPPILSNMRLAHNAYDAINFTDIRGPAIINNSILENNYGHAINITSATGYVFLNNITSRSNTGSGGYVKLTTKHWAEETPELVDLSENICRSGVITSSPMFPFLLVMEHKVPIYMSEDNCTLPIRAEKNQIISIKPLEAIRDPTAEAMIIITDDSTKKHLAIWSFTNANTQSQLSPIDRVYHGPLYQGISSISGSISVTYYWKKNPSQQECSYLRQCFRGIFQISVGETTNPEVVVKNSIFDSNLQHGLRIENLGLYAQILNSKFSNNEFGAGLALVNGSSDVLVHNCSFQNNDRTGLNITMSGGRRIVNVSNFIDNQGHGLDIWNPTWLMSRYGNGPIENTVFLSSFQGNLWNGIRFYNSSIDMNLFVNYSSFINNRKNGIEMVASIVNQDKLLVNFTVGFSSFENNLWHGILISPIGQMSGKIVNSSFTKHANGGAIYIDNGKNFEEQRLIYQHLPIAYHINFNDFYSNSGPFVVLVRLSQNSLKQNCSIALNKFFNNRILNSQKLLNLRSHASAVAVIGSSNVVFTRNFIRNPDSELEISTLLTSSDDVIDGTRNFWGTLEDLKYANWAQIHSFVFSRLFDHESRYTLAKINYFPVLKDAVLQSTIYSDNDAPYRHRFRNGTNMEIGGVIDVKMEQSVTLEYSSIPYRVTRDIFVPQGAILTIASGVQIEFENSIGLFVQGSIITSPSNTNNVRMFMKKQDYILSLGENVQIINRAQITSSGLNLTLINSTIISKDQRVLEGILRVNSSGLWGTICDNQFDLISARMACAELGLVAHPNDWKMAPSDRVDNVFNDTIVMSTVRCQNWMTKFDQCEYDIASEHKCTAGIVNLRCHKPGWAGVKIALTNEQSRLTKVTIEEAGLLDYFVNEFKPAVQINFNKHIIHDISIFNSLSDGLVIYHNDLLSFNKITNIQCMNNLGSGIITKTPWISIANSSSTGNKQSGIKFDPGFSEENLFDFRSSMLKTKNMLPTPVDSVLYLSIHTTGIEVLFMPVGTTHEQTTYWIELKASDPNIQQQLLVTLIDFNPEVSVENVTLFDNSYDTVRSQLTNPSLGSSIYWSIPNDLTRFPVLSNGQYITIRVVVNGTRSGRLAFIVQASSFIDLWNTNRLSRSSTTANGMMYYFPSNFVISHCNMSHNNVGATIIHFNTGTDSQNRSYTMRQSRLSIDISYSRFHNNSRRAIHIPSVSPFANDFYFPSYGDTPNIESSARICRIDYSITNSSFTDNEEIIYAEHNHVPFSNNVWKYSISNNIFRSNRGPINVQIPFVSTRFDWRYLPNIDHSIDIRHNDFVNNSNFQLMVDGYFLRYNVAFNRFDNNDCGRRGLLSMQGMEKSFNISYNQLTFNRQCQFIIELLSYSQTEQAAPIMGHIWYNTIVDNSCWAASYANLNSVTCYTIGVYGNQNVTVRRNVLDNKKRFRFELVAGLVTNQLNSYFDATENYWGTIDVSQIRSVIFDVNNWNNYADVSFHRFLLVNDTNTDRVFIGSIGVIKIDVNGRLGGQITSDLFLQSRPQPYIVQSDLTVLPGVEFRIDSGVTLEFMPNIGILVFGKLIARGVPHRPIIMRPFRPDPIVTPSASRIRRQAPMTSQSSTAHQIRLIGGNRPNEGFVQLFNRTAQRWDYLCDNQVSKLVGSVICRQMGMNATNPRLHRSYLLDYQLYGYDNPFVAKYIWNYRYACRGFEAGIEECVTRFNFNAFQCLVRREFVFLRCESDFLEQNESFWGNIRIIRPELEQYGIVEERDRSYLEHIFLTKAGMLHGELVSAIQTTHAFPYISNVHISKCAWNGIDIIAPRIFVHITNSTFEDNVGYGAAITILNGDSSDPTRNSGQLLPMNLSPLMSSVLGLVDMCDIGKDIRIRDRLILYYRYSYRTIACTKLIRSIVPNKQIAVRFLQLNLFYDPFTKNTIRMFNGDSFNSTESIVDLNARPVGVDDDSNGFLTSITLPSFVTQFGYDILGLQLFASPASEQHGFIMEIITVPISTDLNFLDVNQYTMHRIAESSFSRNQAGAIRISAVGESNPAIDVYYNRFMDNGGSAMLNITADPVVLIRLQNCRDVNVGNNYFHKNRGGSELYLYSSGMNKAIRTNFTNNVITNTTLGSCLKMIGSSMSTARVERNFFANNDCENRDVIKIKGIIMSPFAYNYLNKNRGSVMVNISGEEKISTRSQYLWNGFYDNWSINYTRSTTIFCANSKNIFANNYFRNLQNDFEMVVGNKSIMKESPIEPGNACPLSRECPTKWTVMLERNSCVCYREDNIIATNNWWGEGETYFIKGRIWETTDDNYLIPVDYSSAYKTNNSVLGNGIYCPPTWKFYDRNCYFYFGAPLDYQEARSFCQTDIDAVLADSRDIVKWLGDFMASSQNNYPWINRDSWNTRAWVHSYIPFGGRCPAVRSNWLEGFQCDQKVQYVCQKSPYGAYKSIQMEILISLIIILIIFCIILLLCVILWYRNSKRRHKAFLIRCTELKHHYLTENPTFVTSEVDYNWKTESHSGLGSSRDSASNLYAKVPPVTGTLKSTVTSSARSQYDDDVMKMRRNTLTDTKEAIMRPKSSSDLRDYPVKPPPPRNIEVPTQMINPKKGRYDPRSKPKTTTLNSKYSGLSSEAIYLNAAPGDQLRLSQPDVPQLFRPSDSHSLLRLQSNYGDDDQSRLHTMVDPLLDPSIMTRNKPVMIRSTAERPSISGNDSFNSSVPSKTQDTAALLQQSGRRSSHPKQKSAHKNQFLAEESEI